MVVAVVGLSVGFVWFSSKLTISSSANVALNPEDFDVNFSTVNTSELDGTVSGVVSAEDIVIATDETISNTGDPTITGVRANFTAPGQIVTYSFYAHNAGEYKVYLKSVAYANVPDVTVSKKYTAVEGLMLLW